jgi:hypothetical protein
MEEGEMNVMAPRQVARSRTTASKHKSVRLRLALAAFARSGAGATARPTPCEFDCMENDYYRFLNHPRD